MTLAGCLTLAAFMPFSEVPPSYFIPGRNPGKAGDKAEGEGDNQPSFLVVLHQTLDLLTI